jgi:hypothetical protein
MQTWFPDQDALAAAAGLISVGRARLDWFRPEDSFAPTTIVLAAPAG